MSYEDQKNIAGETEILSSDDQNVAQLLSNLKRIDAPKDFDFHLKARIANASPGDYLPVRLFPILKYALPLALFLVVGSAFVLINSYSGADVPIIADITTENVLPTRSGDTNSGPEVKAVNAQNPQPDEVLTAANPRTVDEPSVADNRLERKIQTSKRPSNSTDQTIRSAPDGLRFNNSNSNSQVKLVGIGPSIPLQFRQILMSLGIDASDAGEKTWKVMRLSKDGIAERSGLQVGDLMEAVDDKPIDSLYDGSFSVQSINVRRDDKVIKIDLKTGRP